MKRSDFNELSLDEIFSYINSLESAGWNLIRIHRQGARSPTDHRVNVYFNRIAQLEQVITMGRKRTANDKRA